MAIVSCSMDTDGQPTTARVTYTRAACGGPAAPPDWPNIMYLQTVSIDPSERSPHLVEVRVVDGAERIYARAGVQAQHPLQQVQPVGAKVRTALRQRPGAPLRANMPVGQLGHAGPRLLRGRAHQLEDPQQLLPLAVAWQQHLREDSTTRGPVAFERAADGRSWTCTRLTTERRRRWKGFELRYLHLRHLREDAAHRPYVHRCVVVRRALRGRPTRTST